MAESYQAVKKKALLRRIIDLAMMVLMLVLMAYSVTGQEIHEWLGIALFALFVLHHLLNLQWFRAVRKGRYSAARIFQTALVVLLFVSILAQMVSGIAMSRHALPFVNVPISTSTARLMHLSCGYWSFLLVSLHLGLHWNVFLAIGRKLRGGKPLSGRGRIVLRAAAGAAAIYGAVCFVQQNIVDYLFLKTEFVFFDYEKPPVLVLVELLAIMALWTLIGYLLWRGIKKPQ